MKKEKVNCPVCGEELKEREIITGEHPHCLPMEVGKCMKCNMNYPIKIVCTIV